MHCISEWNGKLKFLKWYYEIQPDIRWMHQATLLHSFSFYSFFLSYKLEIKKWKEFSHLYAHLVSGKEKKRRQEASDRLTERDDNNAKKELMLISNVLTLNSPTISPASLIQGGEKRSYENEDVHALCLVSST